MVHGAPSREARGLTPLPVLTLDGYGDLLLRLKALGYALHPAADIARVTGRAVFLRHDVDLHLEGALEMATVEEAACVRSTWYVGTRLAYNPAHEPNAKVIRALAAHGHSIGLHYTSDVKGWLDGDRHLLQALSGHPIESWVMHEPSSGADDPHYDEWNPHFLLGHGHYVSDSGMRWHEPWIGALLAGEPERVMLNTHHEHWLGDGDRRQRAHDVRLTVARQQVGYLDHLLKGYADASS